MKHVDISKLTSAHKAQISSLQQAIFSLEAAKSSVKHAIGDSYPGKCHIENIAGIIKCIEEKINNIWSEYEHEHD